MNAAIKERLNTVRRDVGEARKCENINDPVDTYVIDEVAMIWSKLCIRLHIIPNVVTMLSMLNGVAGGVMLAVSHSLGMDLLGALLVIHSVVLDASDGQVARLTKHFSPLGRPLDGLSDGTVYFTLYLACILRLWNRSPLGSVNLWHGLLLLLLPVVFLLYVAQCQLPDYFKNLHMYMIDNAHGHELDRARNIQERHREAPRGSLNRLSLFFYYQYTSTQERRAPKTQELLDAIEENGKNQALCDAFYETSRSLVKKTNFLTVNLRTFVMLLCMLLHQELLGLLFTIVVLEPIRWALLWKYERLSQRLLPLV